MITTFWITYFAQSIIMLVVLLNFLIAYVSQAFDVVYETETHSKYQQRCELNKDYF